MITEAQYRVYEAISEIGADGWPVTVREVQEKLGYASTSPVHMHMIALEREGVIETNPRWTSRQGGWRPVPR